MDAAEYLRDLAKDLERTSVAGRELVALVFEANGRDIDVRTGRNAHPKTYPALRDLLCGTGASCVKDGIAVGQLRRITFAERQVTIEFEGKDGRVQTRVHGIDGVVRSARPSADSGAALEG